MLFRHVNLHLQVTSTEKDWEVMQNRALAKLFHETHSDERYELFTPKIYEMIKEEQSYSCFVLRGELSKVKAKQVASTEALMNINLF